MKNSENQYYRANLLEGNYIGLLKNLNNNKLENLALSQNFNVDSKMKDIKNSNINTSEFSSESIQEKNDENKTKISDNLKSTEEEEERKDLSLSIDFDLKRYNTPYPNVLSCIPINFKLEDSENEDYEEEILTNNGDKMAIIKDLKVNDSENNSHNRGVSRNDSFLADCFSAEIKTEKKFTNKAYDSYEEKNLTKNTASFENSPESSRYILIERIFKFIESEKPLNHVLCGYFFKIFTSISRLKTTQVS